MGTGWWGSNRIHRALAGDTLLVVAEDIPGPPVSPSEKGDVTEALGNTGIEINPSVIPDWKPLFRLLIPADDGGIWLLREGEGSSWFVDGADADGRIPATAELPVEPDPSVLPVVRGGDFWVVEKGGEDVRSVVRFALI